MSKSMDVERIDEKINDQTLVQVVRRKEDEASVRASLQELSRRRSPQRLQVYSEVLADPGQSRRAKRNAITELGVERLPEAQEMLLEQLDRGESELIPSIVRSLGKIGDETALEKLESVKTPSEATAGNAVRFARALIAYRLRLDRELITPPSARSYVEVGEGISFEISKATASVVRRAGEHVERDLPGISLAQSGAARLQCRGTELLLAFSEEFRLVRSLRTLGARSALPLVLLKSGLSLDRYVLDAYFFTQPAGDKGGIDLLGTRPGGALVYAGKVQVADGGFAFSVHALDTRYAPAIEVQGTYDPSKRSWNFSKAISSPHVAARINQAVAPQKVTPDFG